MLNPGSFAAAGLPTDTSETLLLSRMEEVGLGNLLDRSFHVLPQRHSVQMSMAVASLTPASSQLQVQSLASRAASSTPLSAPPS